MSEQGKGSIGINQDAAAQAAAWLLANFYFDLSGYSAYELVERFLEHHPANWVRLAVIEALYQGRYKAVSVEQILTIWQRRNQSLYHFNYEFETLICSKLPLELTQMFSQSIADSIESSLAPQLPSIDSPTYEPEQEVNSVKTSHPFEVFAQSSGSLVSSTTPKDEPKETQPLSVSLPVELETEAVNLEPKLPQLTSNSLEYADYQTTTENSTYPTSDRFSNHYPFPDLFTKLKALALQHQELILNQQQQEEGDLGSSGVF